MGAFFIYIIKSSVCLALFYLFYKLLLSRETFHRFNRIALLSLVALSVILPFIQITTNEPLVMQPTVIDLETLLMMASLLPEQTADTIPLGIRLLLWLYLVGVVVFFGVFTYSLIRLLKIMKQSVFSGLENGIRLYVTPQKVTPFSWMNIIVMSQQDMDENGAEILTHEMAHIKGRHSFDLLIAEVCILLHWFNPAIWLIKQELQNIHEYEADQSVLNQGIDAKRYQLLLIKKAVGTQRFTSVANSFNHSTLKKRITMMLKRKSNPWARLKYLFVLPLAALAVTAFARPEISRELEKISSVKFSELIPVTEIVSKDFVEKPVLPADSVSKTTISKPKRIEAAPGIPANTETPAPVERTLAQAIPAPERAAEPQAVSPAQPFDYDNAVPFDMGDTDFSFIANIDTADLKRRIREGMKGLELTPEQLAALHKHLDLNMELSINEERMAEIQRQFEENRHVYEKEMKAHFEANREEFEKQAKAFAELRIDLANLEELKLNLDHMIDHEEITRQIEEAMEKNQEAMKKIEKVMQEKASLTAEISAAIPGKPLIFIDNKEATSEELDKINPEDIARIEVLKDVWATIDRYGEKARDGVIKVYTKK